MKSFTIGASLLLASSVAAIPASSPKTNVFTAPSKRQTAPQDDESCHAYCSIISPNDGMPTLDEIEQLAQILDGRSAAGDMCVIQRPEGDTGSATTQVALIGSGDTAREARIFFNSGDADIDRVYKAVYDCAWVAEVLRNGLKTGCGGYAAQEGVVGRAYGAADVSNCYHPTYEWSNPQTPLTSMAPGVKVEVVYAGWPVHAG